MEHGRSAIVLQRESKTSYNIGVSTPSADESASPPPSDRSHWLVRKGNLHDRSLERSMPMTPEERLMMVWPLTVQAWAFRGEDVSQGSCARHVVRVFRRKR
jgi:hypothetical protein